MFTDIHRYLVAAVVQFFFMTLHCRASVYGVVVLEEVVVTASMDGTIAIIRLDSLAVEAQWEAHGGTWGVADIVGDEERLVSA